MIIKTWEMSGMGRGYEDSVQKLCWDVVDFLKTKPRGYGKKDNEYEIIREEMHKRGHNQHSGASFACGVGHGIAIHRDGYLAWYSVMKKNRNREAEQNFNLKTMELLPPLSQELREKWKF